MVVGRDGIFKALSISCLLQCLLVVQHIEWADGCIGRGKDMLLFRYARGQAVSRCLRQIQGAHIGLAGEGLHLLHVNPRIARGQKAFKTFCDSLCRSAICYKYLEHAPSRLMLASTCCWLSPGHCTRQIK